MYPHRIPTRGCPGNGWGRYSTGVTDKADTVHCCDEEDIWSLTGALWADGDLWRRCREGGRERWLFLIIMSHRVHTP